MLTETQFAACFPEVSAANRTLIFPGLIKALAQYEINTPLREAAFLAQCGHESGSFRAKSENLNYTALELIGIFPKYFTTTQAGQYAHQPEKIANRVYANKMGNGPESSGDGWSFCGRGWIQVTGKYYYTLFAKDIVKDIQDTVLYTQTDEGAAMISGWYWSKEHNLNALADANNIDAITKVINPAMLGKSDRTARFNKYKKVLIPT